MLNTKIIKLILVASSIMGIGSVQAQVDQQENEVIQDNRSNQAEQRSERRENRAGQRDQRRENRAAHKGRAQRISVNRASGGRR
jgi:hypothetical protein